MVTKMSKSNNTSLHSEDCLFGFNDETSKYQYAEASICRSLTTSKPQNVEASVCRNLNMSKPQNGKESLCWSLIMSKLRPGEASVCQSLSMSKPKYENENKAALAHLYSIWIHNKVTVQYILYNYYANYDVGFVCCPMSSHSINLRPVQVHASIQQFDSAYRLRIGIYRQCLLTMYIYSQVFFLAYTPNRFQKPRVYGEGLEPNKGYT